MKQTIFSLTLCLLMLGLISSAEATHFKGSEITYTCLGGNTYRIAVTEYYDCGGVSAPLTAPSGGLTFYPMTACTPATPTALGAWSLASDTEVTPIDPMLLGTGPCNSPGAFERVRQLVFTRDYDFTGITCPIQLSTASCCRNGAITNLANPNTIGYEVHTNMWNPAVCNNSPQWLDPSYIVLDVGQVHHISMAAFDPDGDSLVYSLDSLNSGVGSGVNYNPTYSNQFPLGLSITPTIDPQTGDISLPSTPFPLGGYAIGVSVSEYRDGVLLGKYYRDLTATAIDGFVPFSPEAYVPTFGGSYSNPPGITYLDAYTVQVVEGTPFQLPIEILYPVPNINPLTVTWSGNLPNAAFGDHITGFYMNTVVAPNPVVRLTWTATNPGRYAFNVKIEDTALYVTNIAEYSFVIVVDSCNLMVDIGPDSVSICPGTALQLSSVVSGGPAPYTYFWSNGATTDNIFVTTPGYYTLDVYDSTGCHSVDTIFVSNGPAAVADAGPHLDLCEGEASLIGTPALSGNTYQWTPATNLSNASAAQPFFMGGVAGTYTYTVESTNPAGCSALDSMQITVHPDLLSGPLLSPATLLDTLCLTDTLTVSYIGANGPGITLTWDFGTATVISGTGAGPYELIWSAAGFHQILVTTTDGLCTATDSLNRLVVNDCVWPGDADNDGIANNNDLLALGLNFGKVGPVRSGATLSWTGQAALAWNDTLPNGVNVVYSDTDGDGIVDADDTLAISLNYGFQHNKGQSSFGGAGDPVLYLSAPSDSISAGETLILDLILGSDSIPADSIYGLALTVQYDASLVDSGSAHFQYTGWLGSYGTDLLGLQHDYPVNGETDLALTRTNHQSMNGYGAVASFSIVMIDDIAGKTSLSEVLHLDLIDVRIIRLDGTEIPINVSNTQIVVSASGGTGLRPDLGTELNVYPQPARDQLYVELGTPQAWEAGLYNLNGQLVRTVSTPNAARMAISLEGLSGGLYLLRVRNEKGLETRKVQILR